MQYAATDTGLVRADAVAREAPGPAVVYLRRAVRWARGLSFHQTVRAICEQYPEYGASSIFKV
jgi:hypothetical protein